MKPSLAIFAVSLAALSNCSEPTLSAFGEVARAEGETLTTPPSTTGQELLQSGADTGTGDAGIAAPMFGTDAQDYASILNHSAHALADVGGVFRLQSDDDAVLHVARGTLNPSTQHLEMRIGSRTFIDENGFNESGLAFDASGVFLTLFESQPNTRFAVLYGAQDGSNRTDLTGVGVIGVLTRVEDLPMSGTASYSGHADLGVRSSGASAFAAEGSFNASVNFKGATASIVARVQSAEHPVTGQAISNPVYDTYLVENMQISGSRLRGGDAALFKDGAQVSPIGAISGSNHQGSLFGAVDLPDGTRKPAEIGGGSILKGDSGTAYLTYLGRIIGD